MRSRSVSRGLLGEGEGEVRQGYNRVKLKCHLDQFDWCMTPVVRIDSYLHVDSVTP